MSNPCMVLDVTDHDQWAPFRGCHRIPEDCRPTVLHPSREVAEQEALRLATGASVYGPAREAMPQGTTPVQQGDQIQALGTPFAVLDVPGHTAGHIAYYGAPAQGAPWLFCGDTLFSGGCGRLFEGTPAQMLASLDALAALPDDTQVYCTHEYTLANQRFARQLEPDNAVLLARCAADEALRAQGLPTVPTTIGLERQTNPFLRVNQPAVRAALAAELGEAPADALAAFTALREWKNRF